MPATNHTQNLSLPIYAPGDKFSVMGDLNDAMRKIDQKVHSTATAAESAATDAATAVSSANLAAKDAKNAKDQVEASTRAAVAAETASRAAVEAGKEAKAAAEAASREALNAVTVSQGASQDAIAAKSDAATARNTASEASAVARAIDGKVNDAVDTAKRAEQNAANALGRTREPVMHRSTYSAGQHEGRTFKSLSDFRNVHLTQGEKVVIMGTLRIASCKGIIKGCFHVNKPSGGYDECGEVFIQDVASTLSPMYLYTAPETGTYMIETGIEPMNAGATVYPANGPHITIVHA